MEKYGFIYIWRDKKRKMFYIGCHWGTEDDGYICSSNRMHKAYKRRPEDFKRRVVQRLYTTRQELLEAEYYWLSLIPDSELGKKFYNANKHHFGHWTTRSDAEEIKAKKMRGRIVSPETREKIRQSLIGKPQPWNVGRATSQETRMKMSAAKIGKQRTPHSAETKAKMSAKAMGRTFSEDTRRKMSETNKLLGIKPPNQSGYDHSKRKSSLRGENQTDAQKARAAQHSEFMKNRIPWNKGLKQSG